MPSEISILAAYQGQATLIRKEVKKLLSAKEDLVKTGIKDNSIAVNTIDMFQGNVIQDLMIPKVRKKQK